jgi:hypothetical protein
VFCLPKPGRRTQNCLRRKGLFRYEAWLHIHNRVLCTCLQPHKHIWSAIKLVVIEQLVPSWSFQGLQQPLIAHGYNCPSTVSL